MKTKCSVCGNTEQCEMVKFKITDDDIKDEDEHSLEGMVGQPHYLVWFCKQHVEVAKKYTNLSSKEATKKIKKELK